jgi:hypothetical protein
MLFDREMPLPRRPSGSRVHAGVWTLVLIGVAWPGCALSVDECKVGDARCAGALAQTCKAHPAGFDGNFNDPSVGHHDASPNSWELVGDCGTPALCKSTRAGTGGATTTDAFCVVEATPDPVCTALPADGSQTSGCDGTTAVDCEGGFAVARHTCVSCDKGSCVGGFSAYCMQPSDCGAGLVCRMPVGYCDLPCTCPEGSRCDACGAVEAVASGSIGHGAFHWTCRGGYCFMDL